MPSPDASAIAAQRLSAQLRLMRHAAADASQLFRLPLYCRCAAERCAACYMLVVYAYIWR